MTENKTQARRVAMITGAARGLGRAQAIALAKTGRLALALVAHHDLAGIDATAASCRERGASVIVVIADLRRGAEVARAVEQIVDAFGSLDILVNNAGLLGTHAPLIDMPEEMWRDMIDSHLTGTFLAIKHVAPHMRAKKWGRIVTMSSIHGRIGGRSTLGHYGAAKAAVIALTRTAARELGPSGITCNVIAPGFIRTEQLERGLGAVRLKELARQVPLGRIGTPEDVAALVTFLVSDGASYVNGAVIDINGGRIEYL